MSTTPINISREEELEWLEEIATNRDIVKSLRTFSNIFYETSVFSTSFSMEDQVIAHLLFSNDIDVNVFTLDTGRLFAETYTVWAETVEKYGKPIRTYYPQTEEIENFVEQNGPNGFYESVEKRMDCCAIRKVAPLKRAIAGQKIWITGIRSEHSSNRTSMNKIEWDESNQIFKYHPLLNWTTEELQAFIKQNHIPINPLHEQGFVSIGCAPCTRAIAPGEDFRAGRWWWEDANKKECGLHIHK